MLALPFHPLITILLLTAGLALISLEFNRPGLILAGAAGLLLTLISFASILKTPHSGETWICFLAAGIAFAIDTRRPNKIAALFVFMITLAGFRALMAPEKSKLDFVVSFLCALLIGFGAHYFNQVARRARVNKGLD